MPNTTSGVYALGVKTFPLGRLQTVGHGFDRRWIFRRKWRISKTIGQRWMVGIPAQGDEGLDARSSAGFHIGLAEIAVIGQHGFNGRDEIARDVAAGQRIN